ncbi:MAG: stage IV sporulation protein A [Lachnospiraceae bacterium]|nr:stage IV sporulation protein A [Lachnospiraceae bacterium]
MDTFNLYKDINARTSGEIYIGVVGPVRTGKSTFIKRFMELMVLPTMSDGYEKERTKDELPQSASGKTIMTTEPKFIPKEAVELYMGNDASAKIRLIDCVGYMVSGASGHMENEVERLVKTPWFNYEIPFTKAAEIGTDKVINEHSTIGIVITTDGSFGEIDRNNYEIPEEETISQLKKINKPFVILLNSSRPLSNEAIELALKLENKYGVKVIPVNCEQLKKDDINYILEQILYEFNITNINFYMPKWLEMLDVNHPFKCSIIESILELTGTMSSIKDIINHRFESNNGYIAEYKCENIDLATGNCDIYIKVEDRYYYEILSELTGTDISDEYSLIRLIKEFSKLKDEYEKVNDAIEQVKQSGYGVVTPIRSDIKLMEPEVIKNGNKFGVKIKAEAPSIHMINANIMTEISPIVGSEEQANDLIKFIKENAKSSEDGIWETNIFGKSIEQIVDDGIRNKIANLSDDTRNKMQNTIQKITNESTGGVICILI